MTKDAFEVTLSDKGITLLAALLGYESVFGIARDAFSGSDDMKIALRRQLSQSVRKKLIRYDLDGTLYIVPALRRAIDCLCGADTVALLSLNRKAGVYIAAKADAVTVLERAGKKHRLRAAEPASLRALVPPEFLAPRPCALCEMMLLEEAEYIHERLDAFDRDAAETRIAKHVRDGASAKLLLKLLDGSCKYLSLQIRTRRKNLYTTVRNVLLLAVDGCVVSLTADENDVLHFQALTPAEAEALLTLPLGANEKGGATP